MLITGRLLHLRGMPLHLHAPRLLIWTASSYGRGAGSTLSLHPDPSHHQEVTVMASSHLCLHAGAREVTLDELRTVKTPPATKTCSPSRTARSRTSSRARSTTRLPDREGRFGLSRNDARLFSTLDLSTAWATASP